MVDPRLSGFCFITNRKLSRKSVAETVSDAISAGCGMVIYRERDLPIPEIIKQAYEIAELCKGKAIFIVDNHIDIAVSVDADGANVFRAQNIAQARQSLGDGKLVGVSVKTPWQAADAARLGADYVIIGPVFDKPGKEGTDKALGAKGVADARSKCNVPIFGIGGITIDNCTEAISAGADGVCAISEVVSSDNITACISDFIARVNEEKSRPKQE